MRQWRRGLLAVFFLLGLPRLAMPELPSALPQDFLSTFQAVDAAYGRKDIEGVLDSYDPHCTFSVVEGIYDLHLDHKDVQHKRVKDNLKVTSQRHDVAWQHQELQELFFVTFKALNTPFLPLQSIHVTSDIHKSVVNRKATEVRLTVTRTIHLDQGQAQTRRPEVDEEVWVKA